MRFSGHESFPLKFGWLKKVYDAAKAFEDKKLPISDIFNPDKAIAVFGVGKNMVAAMRHWSIACRILEIHETHEKKQELKITNYAHFLFGKQGVDPYLENANSVWLLHWLLTTNKQYTLYYWIFNLYNKSSFSKVSLITELKDFYQDEKLPSTNTINRDFDTLVKSYTSHTLKKISSYEELIECPFSEFSLINKKNATEYNLRRESRQTLSDELFIFALIQFWHKTSNARTMTFGHIQDSEMSPGRIFRLDEDDLAGRIIKIAELTKDDLAWDNSSGLNQVVANKPIQEICKESLDKLKASYK